MLNAVIRHAIFFPDLSFVRLLGICFLGEVVESFMRGGERGLFFGAALALTVKNTRAWVKKKRRMVMVGQVVE